MNRIAAFLATTACVAASAPAAIVFNNTTNPTGMVNVLLGPGQVDSLEHGSQVTLAGHERIVTNFAMRMRVQGGGACTFDMQVRFYKNDGPDDSPGTLLWDNGIMPMIIDSGADFTYNFAVPNVRVPGTFTWSVQVFGREGNMSSMGPAEYNPPTVGSAPFGFWRNNTASRGANWEYTGLNEPPFSARVDANPIPGDVNHDGLVNVDDLLAVINDWGPCPQPPRTCPADVNGDGAVNVNDLLIVINNWG